MMLSSALDVESLVGGHLLGISAVLIEWDGRAIGRDDLLLDRAYRAIHNSTIVEIGDE